MKKSNKVTDLLKKEIEKHLAPYPDPMSRNDFRTACRIGTRTSLYLLQSGLVPCLHTGKRTRCYRIAKADVAEYLIRRLTEPEHYAPPAGYYRSGRYPVRPDMPFVYGIDDKAVRPEDIRRYWTRQLKGYPDVLTVKQISGLTGYGLHTVSRWCSEGRLKSIQRRPGFMVPKVWLLEYLCSEGYNSIVRKSRKHDEMIREMNGGGKRIKSAQTNMHNGF